MLIGSIRFVVDEGSIRFVVFGDVEALVWWGSSGFDFWYGFRLWVVVVDGLSWVCFEVLSTFGVVFQRFEVGTPISWWKGYGLMVGIMVCFWVGGGI